MVEDDINEFIAAQQSLHLACSIIKDSNLKQDDLKDISVTVHNEAHISYTPFIYDKDNSEFYIYISRLAEHGKYLPTNQSVSVMLIEDEQTSRNIFARKRLTYLCSVSPISRNSVQWNEFIEKFKQQIGKIMELLSQFNDFDMYCLKPQKGNYVHGFGKAYQIQNGQITHIDANSIAST